MAKPPKWKKTIQTIENLDGNEGVPLFETDASNEIAYIAVTREDPEEGFLGKLTPNATEGDIRKRYGGGTFTLHARLPDGKPAKGGRRLIVIAGDPIFQSEAAAKKWRKANGLEEEETKSAKPGEKPFGLMEMMLLLDKQGEKARMEAREFSAAREREAAQAHQRQIELIQADSVRREQEIAAKMERIDRDAKEERERNREFMSTLIKLREDSRPAEPSADAHVRLLLSGIQLARELGGGSAEDADPVASLVQKLPEILTETRRLVGSEKAAKPKEEEDDKVVFDGVLAEKAKAAVRKIQSQGKDPGEVFARTFDVVSGSYKPPEKKEPPKEQVQRKPPRKVTRQPKSGKTTE